MRRSERRLLPWTLLLVLGCGESPQDGGGSAGGGDDCVSDMQFFRERVSQPVLERICSNCHNPQGAARDSKLVLAAPGETGYLQTNFETLKELASFEKDGTSIVLLKPTAQIDHGGAQQIEVDSEHYAALAEMVERFENPVSCDDGGEVGLIDKVQVLDLPATLRKVKVQILGELPTADELEAVATGGQQAFDGLIHDYLARDPFYGVLKRWFNDRLHTDKYLGGERAVSLLPEDQYPRRTYYREIPEDTEEGRLARAHTNNAVAREPLDLIAYIVRNDKPFTEVLTADYTVVSPFSARAFGLQVRFENPNDPNELQEARIDGYPHAGVLTSPMFLNRFPTTETNRNRHRSRMVWKLFLATDILKKAEQPVDPTRIKDHNPTMHNPQCTICHAQLDPLAGAFMNFDTQGRYDRRDEGWYVDMRPPGFGEETVPADEWGRALQWAAKKLAADEKFALAAVHTVYTGLVGRPPLENPTDPSDPAFTSKRAFYEMEEAFLERTKQVFIESGYNLKSIVPEVVRSPFYRAQSAIDLEEPEAQVLEPLGTMRLLTPEELDAKLVAVLGQPWKRRVGDRNQLLHGDEYRFFYGGIDSDQVLERVTEPNGIMANIALRMANEMACFSVPRDFTREREGRTLFPHVESAFVPEDRNGFAVPEAEEAIRRNIRYLHYRLLGEVLTPGHPEEEATWQIFLQTWREGFGLLQNDQVSAELHGHCHAHREFETDAELPEGQRVQRDGLYTIRAWMAVVTYLLADWRFIYHQ
jgi:hypothetical protein